LSFLSAAFLFALPLAAVPVAIHFFRHRQREIVRWGAMRFLTRAKTKGRTLERLEEMLLMLLRLATVLALVFALTRPLVSSTWLDHGVAGETILVVDDSLSTSRIIDGQSVAERLRQQGLQLIEGLTGGQSVQVILASGAEWATAEGIVGDAVGRKRLRQILEDVQPTEGQAKLLDCLQAAVHLEATEGLAARRIVVLTDHQATSWQLESDAAWRQLGDALQQAPLPVNVEVVDAELPEQPLSNLAVSELDATQTLLRPSEEAELAAEITNTGERRSGEAAIEWMLDGKVVQVTQTGPLDPRGSTHVDTRLEIATLGMHLVSCRIKADDDIPLDQSNAIVIECADHSLVLLVENADSPRPLLKTSQLFAAALGHTGEQSQELQSIFRPEVVEPEELLRRPLDDVRAIIISSLSDLDRATVERLEDFVRTGGGLWVGLGEDVDRNRFNRDWFRDGTGMSPLALDVVETLEAGDDLGSTIRPPLRTHAATAQLADTTTLDIEEARLRQRWTFAERSQSADPVSALLESGDGNPFVVENFVGQGRVLVQAAPLGLEWTNLPQLKSYVVMVRDWLAYITAPTSSRFNLSPGGPIVAAASGKSATLVTPRGGELSLTTSDAASSAILRYSQTKLPGIYRLRMTAADGSINELPFRVERNSNESQLTLLADHERAKLSDAGIKFRGADVVALQTTSTVPPVREPLWGLLLAALLALLAVELLVASRISRQRSGLEGMGVS
jgi:hypothetical protein